MKKKACIFPGQGVQKPFMGKSFYEKYQIAKEVYQEAEDILSMNITSKLFSSDDTFLLRTDFSQVALFVTFIAIWKTMDHEGLDLAVSAGLSLGEYAALIASKKATFQEILPIIQKRGMWMQKASTSCSQAMIAVLGLPVEKIPSKYQIANINCGNQVVLAGSKEEMEQARVELKKIGAKRVVPLKVLGAFHSSYMQSAKLLLKPMIEKCHFIPSNIDLVMNVTGDVAKTDGEIKQNLIEQVTGTTRWHDCVLKMEEYDVEYIEIGPSQLLGMNKKIGVKHSTICIEEVKDLEKLYETI